MQFFKTLFSVLCLLTVCSLTIGLTACAQSDNEDSNPRAESALDSELRGLVEANNLKGKPDSNSPPVDINEPLAQLGKRLFFSTTLGGQFDAACVSCHHPVLGGGDGLSLPIGVNAVNPDLLGAGREHSSLGFDYDGGPTVPRNSPSTFNTVFYQQCLFHDGRIEVLTGSSSNNGAGISTPESAINEIDEKAKSLLHAQAHFPVTSPEEMRGTFLEQSNNDTLREGLASRIINDTNGENWLADFQLAFNSTEPAETLITFDNIALAIEAYEASQVFIDSPWKIYVEGDGSTISEEAKRGAVLFFTPTDNGGAGCSACHKGDFFTDELFHVIAIPQVGRGKGDGPYGDHDYGRFRETGDSKDKYAFRTPTLLNVEVTGPYGHTGAYSTLEEIIKHHLGPRATLEGYDYSLAGNQTGIQIDHAYENMRLTLATYELLTAQESSLLKPVDLTEAQIGSIKAFLLALTDKCVVNVSCLEPWIVNDSSFYSQ